jgi:hypothetical protein
MPTPIEAWSFDPKNPWFLEMTEAAFPTRWVESEVQEARRPGAYLKLIQKEERGGAVKPVITPQEVAGMGALVPSRFIAQAVTHARVVISKGIRQAAPMAIAKMVSEAVMEAKKLGVTGPALRIKVQEIIRSKFPDIIRGTVSNISNAASDVVNQYVQAVTKKAGMSDWLDVPSVAFTPIGADASQQYDEFGAVGRGSKGERF